MYSITTDLRESLLSKKSIDQIVRQFFEEEKKERSILFPELINCLFNTHKDLSLRACFVFQRIAYRKPFQEELKFCMERILTELSNQKLSTPIRYELIRLLEHQTKYKFLNINHLVKVKNICFDHFKDSRCDHSTQLLSISILHNIKNYKVRIGKEAAYLLEHQMNRQAKIFSMIREEYYISIVD